MGNPVRIVGPIHNRTRTTGMDLNETGMSGVTLTTLRTFNSGRNIASLIAASLVLF